jgi:hypothetical protein
LNECARKADPFVRRFSPGVPLDQKIKLMRNWAAVDPEDSCVIALRRFWAKTRAVMTEAQIERLRADVPLIKETAEKAHGDLRRCIPLFCLY